MEKMIITKYVVLIFSSSVFEGIDWFMEVIRAMSTNISAVVESLVASIDDFVWMIDGFIRDTEVESIGKIIVALEGGDVVAGFNAAVGSVIVVGLSVGFIVESSSQVVLNVVDIAIGSSVNIF